MTPVVRFLMALGICAVLMPMVLPAIEHALDARYLHQPQVASEAQVLSDGASSARDRGNLPASERSGTGFPPLHCGVAHGVTVLPASVIAMTPLVAAPQLAACGETALLFAPLLHAPPTPPP